jgi:hypothetical protein
MPMISLKAGKIIKKHLPEKRNQNLSMIIRVLACCAVLILAACQTSAPIETPIVTPEIWQVQLTPALQWIEPGLNLCANHQNRIGLATFERPASELGNHPADITLQWGAPEHLTGYAVVLAYDELVLAVNTRNPIQSLSQKDVQAIYSGKVKNWQSFNQSASFDQKIQTWSYPDGEETQQIFKVVLVKDLQSITAAGIAPAPDAMQQVLAANPGAIGYIPQHWLNQSIRKISLTDGPTNLLRVPILAITGRPLNSQQKLWLACLQSTLLP